MLVRNMESEILAELKVIKEDLQYIKEHMVDKDMVLSQEEEKALDESIEEYQQGKTVKLADFKRDDE